MTTPNLHDLINQPGAGKHIPALIQPDHWDEYAGLPKKKWSVDIVYTITDTETYTVEARCEDEAYEKAEKLAAKDYDDFESTDAREL